MNQGTQPTRDSGERAVLISVVIPAYNEAAYIEETIVCAKAAAVEYGGPVEFIVVDNNSSDDTADIARALGAIVVFEPMNQISRARNAGAAAASGEYVVFLDADTRIRGDILARVAGNLGSGKFIGGGAWAEPDLDGPSRFLFKYLINFALSLKNVTVGPFLYCERAAFVEVGGFSEEIYAAEEFVLARHLKMLGRKVDKRWKIIRHGKGHKIVTSSRRFGRFGGLEMLFSNIHLLWKSGQKLRQKDQCAFWYQVR